MKTKLYFAGLSFAFLITVITTVQAGAQNTIGKISGTIKNAVGNIIHGANITIEGSNIVTGTDEQGGYIFENLLPGAYNLKVTFVGTKGAEKKVTVRAGETALADFIWRNLVRTSGK